AAIFCCSLVQKSADIAMRGLATCAVLAMVGGMPAEDLTAEFRASLEALRSQVAENRATIEGQVARLAELESTRRLQTSRQPTPQPSLPCKRLTTVSRELWTPCGFASAAPW
ncbi:unnamed protein product, partial [Effrenium voratum]